MTDKKDHAAIADLERQLAEHSASFEQWKIDHGQQKGTALYDAYCTQVMDWEREIRTKIAELHGHKKPQLLESGPKNVDSILDELLDNVGIQEFMFALASVHMSDKTFLTSFAAEFQKVQRGPSVSSSPQVFPVANVANVPSFYPGYAASPYGFSTTVSPATQTVWRSPTVIKLQKPVSPVRDYQKKNTGAPFRDFSV